TVRRAAAAGIASVVHAIGDAAVSLAIDVLSDPATRVPALPHRIEHVQLCPPERFADLGAAGIIASVQPCHLITDWRAAERHWGADRCRGAYAFRSLREGGAVLAFGSDAPVEPVDPRRGLFAAVARQDLEGEPSGGLAGRLGTLAPGAAADFAAWDEDPLELDAPALLRLRCLATAVGGSLVWSDIPSHAHA